MSDDHNNFNIFSVNNLMEYRCRDDREKRIVFGAWNGSPEITMSSGFKKGQAPDKVRITPYAARIIEKTLARMTASPGPNQTAPIRFTRRPKNPDGSFAKESAVYFVLQFSTDDKSIFTIATKAVRSDGSSVEMVADIRGFGVESDITSDPAACSLLAAEALLDFIRRNWTTAAFFTRNNLYSGRNGNRPTSGTPQSSNDLSFGGSDTIAAAPTTDSIVF